MTAISHHVSYTAAVVFDNDARTTSSPSQPAAKSVRQLEKSKAVESTRRRSRTASGLWQSASRTSIVTLLDKPRILVTVLHYVSWDDFRGLVRSSSEGKTLLQQPELKDIILAHFIPGYRYCLDYADLFNFRDVGITFRDLELFMSCQRVPLHKYPMHALSTISSPYLTPELDHKTSRYIALAQAHSRFVLLLQSLIHSSSLPFSEEPQDTRAPLRALALAHPTSSVRELVFPAPLSYLTSSPQADLNTSASTKHHHLQKSKGNSNSRSAPSIVQPARPRLQSIASSSLDFLSRSPDQYSSRKSLFGTVKIPPPPPESDPIALRLYRTPRRPKYAVSSSALSDSDNDLFRRPHRRFATTPGSNSNSSQSSLDKDHSPSSSFRRPRSRSQQSHAYTHHSTSVAPHITQLPPASPSSPHDIQMATSRLRAPILRVFYPCTELDDIAIGACEEQLIDAGLWEHLSTGDIVCNLGYMPPDEPQGSSSDVSSDQSSGFLVTSPRKSHAAGRSRPGAIGNKSNGSGASGGSNAQPRQTWLLFDGSQLVTYSPPSPPALADPLALPSPLYYAHIFPMGVNPVFMLKMPRVEGIESQGQAGGADDGFGGMSLTLVSGERWVKSPHSPAGVARARKFMWIARLPPAAFVTLQGDSREGMGDGWLGEWICEAEGTKEGRDDLVRSLSGDNIVREWELVVEQSNGSCIWLRLSASTRQDSMASPAM